ncbi:hypothetical protein DL765_000451 [Monosporascus sp. GIB2]|nr:hypothetical protein DL765_000451 [Monosporascus sp. GIB2]
MITAEKIKDGEREMVKPATEGTRNVLAAVNETGGIILRAAVPGVLAEKEAWKVTNARNRRELVVICFAIVMGLSLTPTSEFGSLFLMG